MSDYWKDCIEAAMDELNIVLTPLQKAGLIDAVETGHDLYGMAHGHECIPNPIVQENDQLSKSLKIEREKILCKACGGRGRIIENYGTRSSDSPCDRCNGQGRHSP